MDKELDLSNPQSTNDLVDSQLDSLAGGIVNLLDQQTLDPNQSGVVDPEKTKASPGDKTTATPAVTDAGAGPGAAPEPKTGETKVKLTWQGQEREVDQDELIELAQKGFDYTRKTQALAAERDQLAPLQGLVTALRNDPVKATQVAAILRGESASPAGKPKNDDPAELFKNEILQEALAGTQKLLQATVGPLQNQQMLDRVKMTVQADPDYQKIHGKIVAMVQAQPPAIQQTMWVQLDQDPVAYLQAYEHFKKTIAKEEKQRQEGPPKPSGGERRETHAPVLETGGVAQPDAVEAKARQERIAKKKAKALRTGDPTVIADWLLSSGAIDHIL